jgi:GH35 family endo-1,4-beta-xylanase
MSLISLLLVVLVCLATPLLAADLPEGGQVVLRIDSKDAVTLVGLPASQIRDVPVEGQPFTRAIELDVNKQGDTPWAVLFNAVIDEPVAEGDVVHLRLWARNVFSNTGSARMAAICEQRGDSHYKLLDIPFTVGTEWQQVDLPFKATRGYPAGQWQFSLRFGYMPQTVQVAAIEIRNYRDAVALDTLPRLRIEYDGRAPDAPWRAAAEERIDRLRKADLKVRVVDADGNPVPGATVRATLNRHAFGFGTCVSMKLLEDSPDGEKYREVIRRYFNHAVIENELKWPNILNHKYEKSDQLVAWLLEHGFAVRGHCLVWPGERMLPRSVVALADDPAAFRKAIADHVTQTVARYRGKLIDWDVINEPYAHHFAMDKLGPEVMVEWFQLAHAADPDVKLYINDYAILASGDMLDTPHQNHYFETIKFLKDRGAPVHGVGMQGHFGSNITSPENLLKILDRYASLGVRIKVTELDIQLADESLRADYLRDLFIVLFSHPAVDAVMQWGFWEGSHWIPSTALFNRDWSIRPHGQVYIDLVTRRWHTDETHPTAADGAAVVRGFHGSYDVTVTHAGRTVTTTAALVADGATVEVRLPR